MRRDRRVIGIDPGLSGFVAVYLPETNVINFFEMPVKKENGKREYDIEGMKAIVRTYGQNEETIAVIERPAASAGAMACVKMGVSYGIWKTIFHNFHMPFCPIEPQWWHKVFFDPSEKHLKTKVRSIKAAQKEFPKVDFRKNKRCKVPDDNKADAALIALYGAKHLGESA